MRRRRSRTETLRFVALMAVRALATAILALAFLSVGTRLYLERGWEPEGATDTVGSGATAMERLLTIRHMERLEAALEVYFLRYGRYPLLLDELVEDGLVSPSALTFPAEGHPYYYRQSGESFVLYPPRY